MCNNPGNNNLRVHLQYSSDGPKELGRNNIDNNFDRHFNDRFKESG